MTEVWRKFLQRPDVKAAMMRGIADFKDGRSKPWARVKKELKIDDPD